jgi:hypothetical protein
MKKITNLLFDFHFTTLGSNNYRLWNTASSARYGRWDIKMPKQMLVSLLMHSYAPQLPLHTDIIDKLPYAHYGNYMLILNYRKPRGKWTLTKIRVSIGFPDHHIAFHMGNDLQSLYLYPVDVENILEAIKEERADVSG